MKLQRATFSDASNFQSLPPASACVICGNTLPEIGGRRITAQKIRGMAVWGQEATLHDRGSLIVSLQLVGGVEAYLVVWGEKERFTADVVERIRMTYLSGFRPWICQAQTCGCRHCPECGKANNLPVASDILYDDGRNTHLMVIPADCGCTNVDCVKYREFEVGDE